MHSAPYLSRLLTVITLFTAFVYSAKLHAQDAVKPLVSIAGAYTKPGAGKHVTVTFFLEASDDTGLDAAHHAIEYRARVDGKFGAWKRYPYDPEQPIVFQVFCTFFRAEFRAVDKAGNRSVVAAREFNFPFANNPPPSREAKFASVLKLPGADGDGAVKGAVADCDFDGDGHLDLATVMEGGRVSVRRNTGGSGTSFATEVTFMAPSGVTALAAGHISSKAIPTENDAFPDLVVAVNGAIRVYINQWDPDTQTLTFLEQGSGVSAVDLTITHVAVADFNSDGFDDIVSSGNGSDPGLGAVGKVAYFYNLGAASTGGINPMPLVFIAGSSAGDLAVGNLDALLDVVAVDTEAFQIQVLRGSGGGATGFYTLHEPYAVAVGDVTGDGKADVMTYGQTFNIGQQQTDISIAALIGNGDGTFSPTYSVKSLGTSSGPDFLFEGDIAIADVTNDGRKDVITAFYLSQNIRVDRIVPDYYDTNTIQFLRYYSKTLSAAANLSSLAVGDLSGDGKMDIVSGHVLPADGVGIFINTKSATAGGGAVLAIAGAVAPDSDEDGDGNGNFTTYWTDTIECTLTYSNNGAAAATNVTITSALPPGTTFLSGDAGVEQFKAGKTPSVRWTIPSLAAGAVGTKKFTVTVTDRAVINSKLTATVSAVSGKLKAAAKMPRVLVLSPLRLEPDIEPLSDRNGKDDGKGGIVFTTHPGDVIEIPIFYKNRTSMPLEDASVFGSLPEFTELKFNGTVPDADAGANPIMSKGKITGVTWDLGTLAAKDSGIKRMRVIVQSNAKVGKKVTGYARFRGAGEKLDVKLPPATIESALLMTIEQDNGGAIERGDAIIYKITVKNRADFALNNVSAVQQVPPGTFLTFGLQPSSDFPPQPLNDDRRVVRFNIGTMAANATVTLRMKVQVQYDFAGDEVRTNLSAKIPGGVVTGSFTAANGKVATLIDTADSDTVVEVRQQESANSPRIGVTKVVRGTGKVGVPGIGDVAFVLPGEFLAYRLYFFNTGNADANSVILEDTIPKGAIFTGAMNLDGGPLSAGFTFFDKNGDALPDGAHYAKARRLQFRLGDMVAGRFGYIEYQVAPNTLTGETLVSRGHLIRTPSLSSVTRGTPEEVYATTVKPAVLEVAVRDNKVRGVGAGQSARYLIEYRNSGGVHGTNAQINIALPAGTVFESGLFLALNESPRLPGAGESLVAPAINANGKVTFNLGTLDSGEEGKVELNIRVSSPVHPSITANGGVTIAPRLTSNYTQPGAAGLTPAALSLKAADPAKAQEFTPLTDGTRAYLAIGRSAAASVLKGDEITYTIFYGNHSESAAAQNIQFGMQVPYGTDFVSASQGTTIEPGGGGEIRTEDAHARSYKKNNGRVDIVTWKLASLAAHGSGSVQLVGSSRVDLQACKLEYSIVSPK